MDGLLACLLAVFLLEGCGPTAKPAPRYMLGDSYRASGVWHYPREAYEYDETGLAARIPAGHAPLTSNGEVFDQGILTGAHPTLQLPAIARVTNLDNGLSTVVRINDRGTGDPHRLILVTNRAAELLRFPASGPVRVQVTVLPAESRQAVESLPGAPRLAVTTAPRSAVQVAELPPPPGVNQGGGGRAAVLSGGTAASTEAETRINTTIPRLPETVTQTAPRPGRLMVRLGTFEGYQYASIQRAKVASLQPSIIQLNQGRTRQYRVQLGPFPDVAQAEAIQDRALAAGVPDARIVVE